MRRAVAAAGLAALLAAAPAAQAETSVSVEKRCYAEGDDIPISASGFTPNGGVDLTLERGPRVLERARPVDMAGDAVTADDEGRLDRVYTVADETGWFGATETRFDMTLRLVDRTRLRDGQLEGSPEVTAKTSFIFSRWNVGIRAAGGKIHPSRPMSINALGYTTSIGRPLFAHWLRDGRRVHTRRLGVLRGPCGNLRTRMSRGFPFRPVLPGAYEVRFSPSRTNTRKSAITHRTARVARRIG